MNPPDPLLVEALATFDTLFDEALAAGEPDRTAMVVATVSHTARPSARTVLLKAHDEQGFVFYTHLDGRKGRELQANNRAALVFHWPRVRSGVQVRVEGMRSEEHTSELQSLMRISYAVFCLKKKKNINTTQDIIS